MLTYILLLWLNYYVAAAAAVAFVLMLLFPMVVVVLGAVTIGEGWGWWRDARRPV